jgi:DNA recombination protein RmuC
MTMQWLVALGVGVLVGGAIGWLLAAVRIRGAFDFALRQAESKQAVAESAAETLRVEVERLRGENAALQKSLREVEVARTEVGTRAQEVQRRLEEERALLADAERKLSDTFKSLAAETLSATTDDLIKRAGEKFEAERIVASKDFEARQKAIDDLVKPARESLGKLDEQIRAIEAARGHAYGTLSEQVRSLIETQSQLRSETANLVKALRAPAVRGRWGEVQLKRVVEMAGMLERCDFFQQESVETDGGRLRPDMRVQLPGGKNIVVDSKAPLQSYLDALEAPTDEIRAAKLKDHARQVRDHMAKLGAKAYWDHLQPTPEFVVMFLPGETFFSAALEQDPALIEQGVNERVILATPTTLIALLRAVAYGWRQEQLAENAEKISALGQELHERIVKMADHLVRMGSGLKRAVDSYNDAVGSIESRVLVTARRFQELGVGSTQEVAEIKPVDEQPRHLSAPELAAQAERTTK